MEMDDSYLTLLTPDGEFLRARKQEKSYSIGDEIHFFPVTDPIIAPFSLKNRLKLKSAWMLIAALLICIGSVVPLYQSNKAYAYMSIDSSPSIELSLNKKMQVVDIMGFNEEADKLISNLDDWKKRDVSELTKIILTEMNEEGFINLEKPVTISTVKTKEISETVETRLIENIEKLKQTISNQPIEINMYTATEEDLENAHDLGVTAGKYYQKKNLTTENKQEKKEKHKQSEEKQENKTLTTPDTPLPSVQIEKEAVNSSIQEDASLGSSLENGQSWNKNQNGQFQKSEVEQSKKQRNDQWNQQYNKSDKGKGQSINKNDQQPYQSTQKDKSNKNEKQKNK
jgi:Anti-sigma factor N-terminus